MNFKVDALHCPDAGQNYVVTYTDVLNNDVSAGEKPALVEYALGECKLGECLCNGHWIITVLKIYGVIASGVVVQ